jgi:hypothetical protein
MLKIWNRMQIRNISALVMGAVILTNVPIDVQASASLGTSAQIGISADLDAAGTENNRIRRCRNRHHEGGRSTNSRH